MLNILFAYLPNHVIIGVRQVKLSLFFYLTFFSQPFLTHIISLIPSNWCLSSQPLILYLHSMFSKENKLLKGLFLSILFLFHILFLQVFPLKNDTHVYITLSVISLFCYYIGFLTFSCNLSISCFALSILLMTSFFYGIYSCYKFF